MPFAAIENSTQLNMKLQLLIKNENGEITAKLSDEAFIMLMNVKIPTTFGILLFMSMLPFMLSQLSYT